LAAHYIWPWQRQAVVAAAAAVCRVVLAMASIMPLEVPLGMSLEV
jgi:hypothetical protein